MTRSIVLNRQDVLPRVNLSWLDRALRSYLLRVGASLEAGRLVIVDELGRMELGHAGEPVKLSVHDLSFYRMLALGGSIGLAEAYALGMWQADDLGRLARLFAHNAQALQALESGLTRLTRPAQQLLHELNRNTLAGSRRNIAAHYDLGNDFYSLFLDETLSYSAGIFERPDATLLEASQAKLERVCQKLCLGPGDHLLEIGTGWGALAMHAAARFGCQVTTTTISEEQYRLARERVERAGLTGRVRVLHEDYRALRGRYDKLVSIEMIEAVGHHYYDAFFGQLDCLLEPHGLALIQAIVTPDQRYERARHSVDFIKRYIFPGCCLPSIARIQDSVARVTQLRLVHLEDLSEHYARTLSAWRARFVEARPALRELGYEESFILMWEWYLAYCEGGFAERYIGDVQLVLEGPRGRSDLLTSLQPPSAARTQLP